MLEYLKLKDLMYLAEEKPTEDVKELLLPFIRAVHKDGIENFHGNTDELFLANAIEVLRRCNGVFHLGIDKTPNGRFLESILGKAETLSTQRRRFN